MGQSAWTGTLISSDKMGETPLKSTQALMELGHTITAGERSTCVNITNVCRLLSVETVHEYELKQTSC